MNGGEIFAGSFGIVVFVFILFVSVLWIILPFAIFGTKPRLEEIASELRKTNKLLRELIDQRDRLSSGAMTLKGPTRDERSSSGNT